MELDEAFRHAGGLDYFAPEHIAEIRGYMPYYLWITNYADAMMDDGFRYDPTPWRKFHCEACGDEWAETRKGSRWKETYKQGEKYSCPRCMATVIARHTLRGCKKLRHVVDAVVYRKSYVDPDAIVAYAAHGVRDYRLADVMEPWEIETDVEVRGIAVFIYGRGAWRFQRFPLWQYAGNNTAEICGYEWRRVRGMAKMSFGSYFLGMANAPERVVMSDTLDQALEYTPFDRAWRTEYLNSYNRDGIKALAMIAKYPCVEYLSKLDLPDYLMDYLDGKLPADNINWRGRDMAAVLKISKSRLAELKGQRISPTPPVVAVLQVVDRLGIRCGAKTAAAVARMLGSHHTSVKLWLMNMLSRFSKDRQSKLLKYIERNEKAFRYADLSDYWETVLELGGTLTDDAAAFPKDFRAAHDRAMTRKKLQHAMEMDAPIQAQYNKLAKKYGFAWGGLELRPAQTAAEVIREGEALHHCVGHYVEKYAKGQTYIFVLRRAVEPDTPWRTVEIATTGEMVQDRGEYNDWGENAIKMSDNYKAMLDTFWEAWRERRKTA